MAFDIIKEQRMLRALFYSLISSAELIENDKKLSEQFVAKISKFIRERTFTEETSDVKEIVQELIQSFGWKSVKVDYNTDLGQGKVTLGKNRYIINEIADSEGTLLVLRAFIEGMCYHLFSAPVKAEAIFSLSSTSHYEITLRRVAAISKDVEQVTTATPAEFSDMAIHEALTIENMFGPIFSREIPPVILFEIAWKVITESYMANYVEISDEAAKLALKTPSMDNLSFIIMKLTEEQSELEIMNMAEIIGEFFVKILKTKTSDSPISTLQSTLQDKHASSYLIYYDCRKFCAEKQFVNRCVFIRGIWIGILNEIYGFQVKVKDLFHAGKRDKYCMIDLVPEKND